LHDKNSQGKGGKKESQEKRKKRNTKWGIKAEKKVEKGNEKRKK
jgi:hypothetical protein